MIAAALIVSGNFRGFDGQVYGLYALLRAGWLVSVGLFTESRFSAAS
jgi:hypothetical protein